MRCLTAPEATSLRPRCLQGLAPSGVPRKDLFYASLLPSGGCWQSLVFFDFRCTAPISAFLFIWHSPVCAPPVSTLPLFVKTLVIVAPEPPLLQYDLNLTQHICNSLFSKEGELGLQHMNLGERIQHTIMLNDNEGKNPGFSRGISLFSLLS